MIGGSRKRYQVGKRKLRSSSRNRRGGGWFSSLFGSSEGETEENKGEGGFLGLIGKPSNQNTQTTALPQLSSQYQLSSQPPVQSTVFGGSRRRSRRRGGKHCKTSKYRLGGKRHRKTRK
jgi:hypothetical protein